MASRPISAEQMLAAIPSLPRPMLTRLVDQMIDRLYELDGDEDKEATATPSDMHGRAANHRHFPATVRDVASVN